MSELVEWVLESQLEQAMKTIKELIGYIPTDVVSCEGNCGMPNCEFCNDDASDYVESKREYKQNPMKMISEYETTYGVKL